MFSAGPEQQAQEQSVPRRTSTASATGPQPQRISEDIIYIPDRMPERMSEDMPDTQARKCPRECQNICQKECQNECLKTNRM